MREQDNDRRKHLYGLECRMTDIEKQTSEATFRLLKAEESLATLVIPIPHALPESSERARKG